jgi:hypothetical protein
MKKGLFALVVLATILAAAPDAAADHCFRCSNFTTCFPATSYGKPFCDDSSGSCVFSGNTCTTPHPFAPAEEPLAVDFVLVSVERRDEPPQQPAGGEVRVASIEVTQQTADR